ncbi:hypothetical protein Pr1d_09400 [Bythopirellula goksoeyrii]|uniref:Transmembrane protein n=1 Tax=Bythopirellula goksoeyrii TaxID=1400387 RepID=A0A5B9Q9U8_9BACT|nr:hypothetical protein Pr1d_09400 [Bythopirellula goksoeyrii]
MSYRPIPDILRAMETSTLESGTIPPPLSLRFYLWFVIAITVFELCRVATMGSLSFTIPFTGWMIAFPYMFSIFFVFAALRGSKFGPAIKSVRSFLVFAIILGVLEFAFSYGREDFDNPYLRVSLWRPVFTVMIPCLWLIVLNSKAVSTYCSGEPV